MNNLPFISVIIPVFNESEFIAQTLQQLLNQNYPDDFYEVLVMDGMSTDNTVQIVESFQKNFRNLKVIENPKRLSSSARNIGVRESRGEFVIIIDGHVYIENRNLLQDMVEIFQSSQCEVLSRPQPLTPPDNNRFQNAVAHARASVLGHGTDSTIYDMEYEDEVDPSSSGAMYKKSIFEKVGYVDENFDAAEDYEFNYRISKQGMKSFTSPKLAVYYYPRKNLSALFGQMVRYGIGRFRFIQKHREAFISGNLIPPLFFVTLFVLYIISIFVSKLWIIPSAILGIYIIAILVSSIVTALKRGIKYFCYLPFILVTIHLGLACGFLKGIFRGK